MSLVKLLLFLLVLNEFNPYGFCSHFGIIFVPSNGNEQEHKWEGIHALIYDLACTSTHFHAAWARIRIHKKVYGPSFLHRVHQFVTWDTELSQPPLQLQVRHLDMALMYLTLHVPQTDIQRSMTYPHKGVIQMARVHLKSVVDSSFFRETRQLVFKDTPTQLLLNLVNDIQKKEPITLSLLESKACQDVRFLYYKDVLPNCRVIACGETSLQLDFLVSEYFRVPFSSIDVDMDVQLIVLEPENSLSAVHDPLTYLLQENQLPSTQPDFASLMKNQKLALLHAMQFPKVKYILYVVRSFHSNETTEVIHACCEIHSNFEWVPLPSSLSICTDSATFQHGLFVFHPELAPNGMFIALLQRVASPSSSKASSNINLDTQPSNICSEGDEVQVEEEEEEEQEEEESEEINKVNPIINSNTKPSKKKRKNKRKTKSLTYLHVTKSHDTLEVYGQGYYLKEQRKNSGPTKPVYTSLPHLKPWK
ncbi:hypothetical protein HMI55_001419 [Coelomomyces lativittatus]|nr:hypothetical protein HMI55_001419 [Coelomomyces lativittatus]